jgi:hypothetical protein
MNSYDIKLLVNRMHDSIRSDDPRMQRSVLIIHADDSTMFYRNAFMVRCHNWLLVFSEHQGSHYFCINDLSFYQQFETIKEPIELVDNNGEVVKKLNCSYCQNEITVKDVRSIYDELGDRVDADICEGCEEIYLSNLPEEPTIMEELELID